MTDDERNLTECLAWEVANAEGGAALVAVEREAHRLPPAARAIITALLRQAHFGQINAAILETTDQINGCRAFGGLLVTLPPLPPLPTICLPQWTWRP